MAPRSTPHFHAPVVGPSFLVSQVGGHAALEFTARLAPLGLKPLHAGILRLVGRNTGLSQQALSALLGVFASRLVLLIDDLEKRQLIERRESPTDRRSYQLRLTARGRKTLAAVGALTAGLEDNLFAALSPRERGLVSALLARVADEQGLTPGVHTAYRQLKSFAGQGSDETMQHAFVTKIHRQGSRNVTGIVVAPRIVEALGQGKRPPVKVTLNGYTYRSTIASMGGKFMISLSAQNRERAGVRGGEEVEVHLELDAELRTTALPDDLKAALVREGVLPAFEQLPSSRRKELVRQVETAKAPATRTRRIEKAVELVS
jgi:DNA-binding MarR family transcriptional regulator